MTKKHNRIDDEQRPDSGWKLNLYNLLNRAETRTEKTFDTVLIILIVFSVLAAMFDTVNSVRIHYSGFLKALELIFTIIFTIEYSARLTAGKKPLKTALSFFGIIDLIAILPTYLSLFFGGFPNLLFLRVLRVLRIFRLFKLWKYSRAANFMIKALRAALPKIGVFLFGIGTLIIVFGSIMYLVEGPENGFSNIFVSLYWTIVTITTVGYGDITPQTPLGQILSSVVMIMGFAIIAVPTGIVSVEINKAYDKKNNHTDTNSSSSVNTEES